MPSLSADVVYGSAALNQRGFVCCHKPRGCSSLDPRCGCLRHPYKRYASGEISLAELDVLLPPTEVGPSDHSWGLAVDGGS